MSLGIAASGGGSGLAAILEATAAGRLAARVAVVLSNNSGSGALARARAAGIPTVHASGRTHPQPEALDAAICETFAGHGADLILLTGYMKKLGPLTRARFRQRVWNVHPALLPAFGGQGMYGLAVHEAVLAAGVPVTGATVQLVEEAYDSGPILAQAPVAVLAGDTATVLAERVKVEEGRLLIGLLARASVGDWPVAPR